MEKHGLSETKYLPGIQGRGATIDSFCKEMAIDYNTFTAWCKKSEFSNALTRAHEVYLHNIRKERVYTVVDSLYDAATGKSIKSVKGEKIIYFPPNVDAIKFFLTNMDPENWKNKQDTTADLNVDMDAAPVIMFSDNPKPEGAAGEFTETRTEP